MFSRNDKNKSKPAPAKAPVDLKQTLQDAIDRNSSIGIVRLGYSGQDPLAQGRMLALDDKGLVIEQLQIIGKEIRFHVGSRVEAYVKFNKMIMLFEAEIKEVEQPTYLNERRVVRSMLLTKPNLLRQGDRRSAFRSSVTAMGEETPVQMWFLDRIGDPIAEEDVQEQKNTYYTDLMRARRAEPIIPVAEEDEKPIVVDWPSVIEEAHKESPHAVGRLADLTANGLGFLMYGVAKMQLDRFERIAVRFTLEQTQIDLVVELRHAVDIKGSTCRVGCLIVHPSVGSVHAPQRRLLERLAMQIQREQLRLRKAG